LTGNHLDALAVSWACVRVPGDHICWSRIRAVEQRENGLKYTPLKVVVLRERGFVRPDGCRKGRTNWQVQEGV
jgi:hypothetical protein